MLSGCNSSLISWDDFKFRVTETRRSFEIKAIVNSVFNRPSGTAESPGDVKQTLKDGGDGVKGLKAGRRNSSPTLHCDLSQLRQ